MLAWFSQVLEENPFETVWNDKQWNGLYAEATEFPLLNDFKEHWTYSVKSDLDIVEPFLKKEDALEEF